VANRNDLKDPEVNLLVTRVVLSQYQADLRFIDICAESVKRTADYDEKLGIVADMACTRKHMAGFRRIATELCGHDWATLDHPKYVFSVLNKRYDALRDNPEPVELLVGLYLFSHGVVGYAEFTELYRASPEIFLDYDEFSQDVIRECETGEARITRLLERQPELRQEMVDAARRYGDVLVETATDGAFGTFLKDLAAHDLLTDDVATQAANRYNDVFSFLLNAS
jgi:hypothetical protein